MNIFERNVRWAAFCGRWNHPVTPRLYRLYASIWRDECERLVAENW